jgi:hypothetical protein
MQFDGSDAVKSTLEVLTEARALIADPKHWTTRAYARGKDRIEVRPNAPEADCWCAVGALAKASGLEVRRIEDCSKPYRALQRAMSITGFLSGWNDRHGHDEVLAAFDRAIEEARAEAAQ